MDIHKNARATPYSRAEMARRVMREGRKRYQVGTGQSLGNCAIQLFKALSDGKFSIHNS